MAQHHVEPAETRVHLTNRTMVILGPAGKELLGRWVVSFRDSCNFLRNALENKVHLKRQHNREIDEGHE